MPKLYEIIIHKCQECPECNKHPNLIGIHYCDITGKKVEDIRKISKDCPLQETRG